MAKGEEVDVFLSELKKGEIEKLGTLLAQLGSLDCSEWTADQLESLNEILSSETYAALPVTVRDDINRKIDERRTALGTSADEGRTEPEGGIFSRKSSPKEPVEEMAAYDLRKEYELTKEMLAEADTDEKKKELEDYLKEIVDVAKKKTEEMKEVSTETAPLFSDYYQIMKDNDPYFVSSRISGSEELEDMLRRYDENHGLSSLPEDLTAEQFLQNEADWKIVEAEIDQEVKNGTTADPLARLKEDVVKIDGDELLQKIEEEYPEEWETLKESIKSYAALRLSLKKAEGNIKQTYIDEVGSVADEYGAVIQSIFASDDLPEKRSNILKDKDVMAEFYEQEGMAEDEWNKQKEILDKKLETLDTASPEYAEVQGQIKEMVDRQTRFVDLQLVRQATSTFATRGEILNNRIAQKAGLPHVSPRAHQIFKKATKPKVGKMVSQLMINLGVNMAAGAILGPAGLAAVSVVKTGIAVHKAYKRYKETVTEGKPSIKGFFKYLKANPNEKRAFVTQTLIAASSVVFTGGAAVAGTLSYGMLGGALGANAAAIGSQMAFKKVTNAVISGISSAVAFTHANKDLVPLQKQLLTVLKKYVPELDENAKVGGLFNKNRETSLLKDLQGMFKEKTESEFYELVKSYAPEITNSDMEKVVDLMSKIKDQRTARVGAAIGTLAAGFAASGLDTKATTFAHDLFHGNNSGTDLQTANTITQGSLSGDRPNMVEVPEGGFPEPKPFNVDDVNSEILGRAGINADANADQPLEPGHGVLRPDEPLDENSVNTSVGTSNATDAQTTEGTAGANTGNEDTAGANTGNEGSTENNNNGGNTDVNTGPVSEAENLFKFDKQGEFEKVTDNCPTPIIKALQANGLWKEGQDDWSRHEWSAESVRKHLLGLQQKASAGELTPEQMEGLKTVDQYMHNPQIYQDARDVNAALEHIREAKEAARRAAEEAANSSTDTSSAATDTTVTDATNTTDAATGTTVTDATNTTDAAANAAAGAAAGAKEGDVHTDTQETDQVAAELNRVRAMVEHKDLKHYSTVQTNGKGFSAAEEVTRDAAINRAGRDTFVVTGDEQELGFSKAKITYNADNTHIKTTLTHADGSESTMDKKIYEHGVIATGKNMAHTTITDGGSDVNVTITTHGTIGGQTFSLAKGENNQDYLISYKAAENGGTEIVSRAISSKQASNLAAQMRDVARNGYRGK